MQGGSAVSPYQWKDLLCRDLPPTDFDAVLSGVLQSTGEMEEIQRLNETDLQSVIDTLGKVRELFCLVTANIHSLTLRPPVLGKR